MKLAIVVVIMLCLSSTLPAQYKSDNVLFKTVYPEELQKQLKNNPGHVFLDVRSDGEYHDTSSSATANIGRLKNAKHININDLGSRLNELQGFKKTPIFVYCSHSQRSRRASKMLADSGFTKVYNINGGLTTLLQTNSTLNNIYETKNEFKTISGAELCRSKRSSIYILDVRPDSSFQSTSTNEKRNALGRLNNSVNIPLTELTNSLSRLPKDKKIVLVDEFGDQSIKAGKLLRENGFTKTVVLFNGLDHFVSTYSPVITCKNEIWKTDAKYTVIPSEDFAAMLHINKDVAVVDVRPEAEFKNSAKDAFRNIGHLYNAINIPSAELTTRSGELAAYKQKPVFVYAFSSGNESFTAAKQLVKDGYQKVYIIAGGLFGLRWKAANLKGKSELKNLVVDVPAENQ